MLAATTPSFLSQVPWGFSVICFVKLSFNIFQEAVDVLEEDLTDMDHLIDCNSSLCCVEIPAFFCFTRLHLIDFEQLKIENQTINEKIEERNEELVRLRKKNTTMVQASERRELVS